MTEKKQVKKEEKKKCLHCKKKINNSEKQVVLITKNENKIIEEICFHFSCWKDYFEERVKAKAEGMQTAGSFMDQIVGNNDILGTLGSLKKLLPKNLKFNLKDLKNMHNFKEEILKEFKKDIEKSRNQNNKKNKKQNGKRKRKTTRKNTQKEM